MDCLKIVSKYCAKKTISLFFNSLLSEPLVTLRRSVKNIDGQGGPDQPGATGCGVGLGRVLCVRARQRRPVARAI